MKPVSASSRRCRAFCPSVIHSALIVSRRRQLGICRLRDVGGGYFQSDSTISNIQHCIVIDADETGQYVLSTLETCRHWLLSSGSQRSRIDEYIFTNTNNLRSCKSGTQQEGATVNSQYVFNFCPMPTHKYDSVNSLRNRRRRARRSQLVRRSRRTAWPGTGTWVMATNPQRLRRLTKTTW